GTVSVNPDGTLAFTPAANFTGQVLISYTVTDPQVERAIRDRLLAELDLHEALAPRWGSLIGLTVACHLATVVFGERGGEADARATWIADRDAVLRAVVSSIAETEGQL
ncbi:MAG: cadherin-like domain-containing protein, partial [Myxococcota bacterium]